MLTAEGKRSLRARAHHLKPVVLIGQHGVSDAVVAEIGIALDAHELIKIRFRGTEREAREADVARICATLAACSSALEGIQPTFKHTPPSVTSRSTSTTFRPRSAARNAAE